MRLLKFTFTAVVIILILSIPTAIYYVRFGNKTAVGRTLKDFVIRYPVLIPLLDLNEPGDEKYVYLNPAYVQLRVNVYTTDEIRPDGRISNWINEIISETTGKKAVISNPVQFDYENRVGYSDEDLNSIRDQIAGKADSPSDLNLIYLNLYAEKPSSVGLVLHRDTIFLFKGALEKLSESGYINDVLEKTTIMHEWGHLLGIDHINTDYCIMSETVEVFDNPPIGKTLPKKYCWEELEVLKKVKKETL